MKRGFKSIFVHVFYHVLRIFCTTGSRREIVKEPDMPAKPEARQMDNPMLPAPNDASCIGN